MKKPKAAPSHAAHAYGDNLYHHDRHTTQPNYLNTAGESAPQTPKPPSRATRPAGTGTKPQHSQPHPPRQTASLRRVNLGIYNLDRRESATTPRLQRSPTRERQPPALPPKPSPAAAQLDYISGFSSLEFHSGGSHKYESEARFLIVPLLTH